MHMHTCGEANDKRLISGLYDILRADLTVLITKSKLSYDLYLLNQEKRLGEYFGGVVFLACSLHVNGALLYVFAEKMIANVNVLAASVDLRVP